MQLMLQPTMINEEAKILEIPKIQYYHYGIHEKDIRIKISSVPNSNGGFDIIVNQEINNKIGDQKIIILDCISLCRIDFLDFITFSQNKDLYNILQVLIRNSERGSLKYRGLYNLLSVIESKNRAIEKEKSIARKREISFKSKEHTIDLTLEPSYADDGILYIRIIENVLSEERKQTNLIPLYCSAEHRFIGLLNNIKDENIDTILSFIAIQTGEEEDLELIDSIRRDITPLEA